MSQFIYGLNCQHGRKYVGHTNDVTKRIKDHCNGVGASFTAAFKPCSCFGIFEIPEDIETMKFSWIWDGNLYTESGVDVMEDLFAIMAYTMTYPRAFVKEDQLGIVAGGHRAGGKTWDGDSCRKRLMALRDKPEYSICLDAFWEMIANQGFKAENINQDTSFNWWRKEAK